jgi:hypothetical protein
MGEHAPRTANLNALLLEDADSSNPSQVRGPLAMPSEGTIHRAASIATSAVPALTDSLWYDDRSVAQYSEEST